MSFESFSDFLAMGGHGLYVWLSYGVAALIFIANIVLPMTKKKQIVKKHQQRLKRESVA
ncbi:heme exporter protein CcmD [Alkalimarinus sediminis]|uniref:Heme exporter protein D n=1 Tax=Alkalimarinus sediminis TaxID=1632866 RepID=A0A9E8KR83_9ALTE|nr:heme exporter protein CcmD [Alkalimarinus sediminis]UZW76714.1 heme exporter protein CcmD [Alkalimarinus sediminis]